MIVLATIGAGGVITASDPTSKEEQLKHHIKTSDCNWLIAQPGVMTEAVKAADTVGLPRSHIFIFDTKATQAVPEGFNSWKELMCHGEADWVRFNDLERSKNTTAARLFSSGTTGPPKAISISHRNFIAQHVSTMDEWRADYIRRILIAVPCFHAAAFPTTHISSLKTGDMTYLMPVFDLKAYVEAHLKYEITEMVMLPPIVRVILNSPLANPKFFQTVRRGLCGAAPMDKDTQERFRALLAPGTTYTQVWGMTETTTLITAFAPWEHDDTGSVGRQLPSVEIKLIDGDGNAITAYNRPGEVLVRGPAVSQGYHNNTKATANDFSRDGWFHTGDIGYCDEETKKWYIVERKKEIINMRGKQIAPAELEATLLSHPEIADCAVIGVKTRPSSRNGGASSANSHGDSEYPRAYIVRKPGSDLTDLDVHRFMQLKMARFQQLTGGIRFVEAIPKSLSGKILKRVLREEAKAEIEGSDQEARPHQLRL